MRRLILFLAFLLFYPIKAQDMPFANLQRITKDNLQRIQLLYTFPLANAYYRLDWSDDGSILILNNQIYRLNETGLEYLQTIEDDVAPQDIAFHPNGHWLLYATSRFDGQPLVLYDMDSQEVISKFTAISRDLGRTVVPAWGVAISPDGRYAASHHYFSMSSTPFDVSIRLWDMAIGQEIAIIGMDANWVGFSPDTRYLVADAEGAIRLWEIERLLGYSTDTYLRLEDLVLNGRGPVEWLNDNEFYYYFDGQKYLWNIQNEDRVLVPEADDIRAATIYNQDSQIWQHGIQDFQSGDFIAYLDSFDAHTNDLIQQIVFNPQKTLLLSFEYAPEPIDSPLPERGLLLKFYGIP